MKRKAAQSLARPHLRCAIYTRVSTDAGLEQDFNSLDAQREAGEAYIKSQSHEGWSLIRDRFDDGGFSGGSLDRPALGRLLEAVRAKRIDIIVVYKVDRLTRSLADFAKLVELFDATTVSFVSITQSFNTTTSMGRLTLNVLLSFAQFEREVTGERIRDKIAASKKKGIWVGGVIPLGYALDDHKLVVDEAEAITVRLIFERYLALGSILKLLEELRERGVITRLRSLSTGRTIGGIAFAKGALAHLLKNRTYIGELNHHGNSYPADHAAIIDRDLFEKVQATLSQNTAAYHRVRTDSNAILTGLLVDDRGGRMGPVHARKGNRIYRYYVSRSVIEGDRKARGAISRISAQHIEANVLDALSPFELPGLSSINNNDNEPNLLTDGQSETTKILSKFVERIAVGPATIQITFHREAQELGAPSIISVPWSPSPAKPRREIMLPPGASQHSAAPIRSDTRATLLAAMARGRQYLDELITCRVASIEALAAREQRSTRSVHMMLSLAFLSPAIVVAAIEGRLPRGIGVTRLIDLPTGWARQHDVLGLAPLSPAV